MPFGLPNVVVDQICSVFARHPEVRQAILYGSRAMGSQRDGSDVDLTLTGKTLNFKVLTRIEIELDELLLPYKFDLSIRRQINNDSLLNHIERVGILFYEREREGTHDDQAAAGMKKGWKQMKLRNVCELINGRAYSKPELLPQGKYPVLRVGNFFTNNNWYYSDLELGQEKYCDNGDLLYAWSASFGPRIWEGEKVIYHYHIWKVQPNIALIDKKFLFLWFLWDTDEIKKDQGAGTTMIHVSKGSMEDRDIFVPPLPEQQRIVGLLDEAFAGIATAQANAEQNLRNARALFESHLQSVFTQSGPSWKQKTLEEISTIFGRGKSRHRPRNEPKLYGGKYPFIQTGDIRNADHFITEYSQTYSEAGLAQSKLWPKGTICITIAANIAETAILGFDACFPDSVIGVVANPKEAEVGFIEYLLQSFKARIQAMGKGSAQANINMGTFEHERFPFPPIAEQIQMVEKLDALSEETQRLESLYQQKIAALAALKKSLLHQAFAGEL